MKRNVSVVCFKYRCNILISGKIIKEIPGSVASGTHCVSYSKTLEKEVIKDTGLKLEISKLSPSLNTGFAIEKFNLVGKISEERYLLHLYIKGELTEGALNFKILTQIETYP